MAALLNCFILVRTKITSKHGPRPNWNSNPGRMILCGTAYTFRHRVGYQWVGRTASHDEIAPIPRTTESVKRRPQRWLSCTKNIRSDFTHFMCTIWHEHVHCLQWSKIIQISQRIFVNRGGSNEQNVNFTSIFYLIEILPDISHLMRPMDSDCDRNVFIPKYTRIVK